MGYLLKQIMMNSLEKLLQMHVARILLHIWTIRSCCLLFSNETTMISKNSYVADKSAINPLEEIHDEAKETVGAVEVHDVEFAEENKGVPRVASGDALNRDNQPVQGEQCVTSNADLSLKPLDSVKGVASQVVNQTINVTVNRAFAGYTGKKLLVLDVNGLLVDISSYVPYDHDPDDIILKKAGEKE
ncbi:UNVERIFIED_CONTAM: hypothetical protein Sradi_2879100 [Sesamum radiatum]|uniref:Uncharacterized protein n=1 Tax=Sesamum radiatum TaxID=300843 RepID=A0AAW2RXN9_SESRA